MTEPADPVFEIARFQLRVGDPSLYTQPVAPTSGLLNDAGAVLSIGVARVGSGLIGVIPERWEQTSRALKDFVATDEDSGYEGLRSFTRYYFAKSTGRVLVVRSFADEDGPSCRLVQYRGGRGPPTLDTSLAIRGEILSRAASMLNIPYVGGGTSTKTGWTAPRG